MTTTQTTAQDIHFTRDGDQYRYDGRICTAGIFKFRSAYGDMQWIADITYTDGRTITGETIQTDTLRGIRVTLAIIENGE